MRASMTAGGRERCRSLACIWGDPNGILGGAALLAMALKNGAQNRAALDALALKPGDAVIEMGCGPAWGCAPH